MRPLVVRFIVLAIVAGSLSPFATTAEAQEETLPGQQDLQSQQEQDSPQDVANKAEHRKGLNINWFGVKLMGGSYGGGLGLTAITLNWHRLVWHVVHGVFMAGLSPYQIETPAGEREFTTLFALGTMVALPVVLTDDNRHELQFGLGVSGGEFFNGYRDTGDCGTQYAHSSGPFIEVEASYLFRVRPRLNLTFGVHFLAAVTHSYAWYGGESNCGDFQRQSTLPWPSVSVFAGILL